MTIISDIVGSGIANTVNAVGDVINKKSVIEADLIKTEIQADTQVAIAQNEVNKSEAESKDKFTSRWRPTVGYICAIGFGYQYVLQPFILLIAQLNAIEVEVPSLDMAAITSLLLGLAGMRTYEKKFKYRNK